MIKLPPEKLASFYLGAKYDSSKSEIIPEPISYDAKDLTTHAVCFGMTGSGKTGLIISLLEEAAMDRIPALIIDPKGDMTNLLLQFPNLDPEEFKPWLSDNDAKRKGMDINSYADSKATLWREGLAKWGQNTDRIQTLNKTIDYTIYTPGSNAGIPINILGSFAAPRVNFDDDSEMLRERIQGLVAALLGMIGSKEDPVRSREAILLSNLFEHHWRKGEDLNMELLIKGIQSPPMTKLGVFDIETFYPTKDRFNLAMDFNTLVASPQFSYWLQGDVLDIDKLYFTADGKPRHSIFYIAHLSDSERMFFVTLLLNSLISWMRRQKGTSSLRSLLCIDEVFGYFPPTANPPTKKPLLTLLKQARAFGLGCILATQNPVDIDYKGLSNAGTWFIGKLQTERDKMRVLEGLTTAISEAGASTDIDFDKLISELDSRTFILHNVHADSPVVYHTRWVMSYLAGPLTRPQIKMLMQDKSELAERTRAAVANIPLEITNTNIAKASLKNSASAPIISPDIEVAYLKPTKELPGNAINYIPQVLAFSKVRFYNDKRDIDIVEEINLLTSPPDDFGRINWEESYRNDAWDNYLSSNPISNKGTVTYADIPESMNTAKKFNSIEDSLSDYLYQNEKFTILVNEALDMYQRTDESKEAFYHRCLLKSNEIRDEEIEALEEKYEDKLDKIENKIEKEARRLQAAEEEEQSRKTDQIINVAETLFSVFGGRRRRSFSTTATKNRMRRKAAERVDSIEANIEDLQEDYKEMENVLEKELIEIREKWESSAKTFDTYEVTPRRADVRIDKIMFVWSPTSL